VQQNETMYPFLDQRPGDLLFGYDIVAMMYSHAFVFEQDPPEWLHSWILEALDKVGGSVAKPEVRP
jgi:hypothetical protein